MSLDARYPELDAFLQIWRNRLNRRYLAGEALTAWAIAAPVLGAVVWWLPLRGRWFWWLGATAVVSLAFAAVKLRSGLSRHQAASWIDERSPTEGILRAASECLDAVEPSATAQRVLERAQTVSQKLPSLRVPRSWLWRAGAAGLASLAVVAWATLPVALPRGTPEGTSKPIPTQPSLGLAPNDSQPLSPHDTAQRLFPEDPRMAALAEQALASGDPGALQSLLQQNGDARASAGAGGSSSGTKGDSGSSSGGKPAPGGEPQAGGSPPPAGSLGQNGGGSSKQGSGGTEQKTPGSKAPSKGSGPGSGSSGQGQPSPRSPGQAGSGSGESSVGSGGAPGQGHSDLTLGPVQRGTSDKTLTLNEPQTQGLYEYVLPGAGAKLPNADVLADSRRAAEAVISRTSPPLEYESTIRDYFLSLSQEVSP